MLFEKTSNQSAFAREVDMMDNLGVDQKFHNVNLRIAEEFFLVKVCYT